MKTHILHKALHQIPIPITINLIGLGGNGLMMLGNLIKIHLTLKQLDHPGLDIRVFDPDKVERHNIGRQLFSISDIGIYKVTAIVQRYLNNYGNKIILSDFPVEYTGQDPTNFTITCTDTVKSRIVVKKALKSFPYDKDGNISNMPLYWLDLGNTKKSGQFVLGTVNHEKEKSKNEISKMKDVFELYPNMKEIDDNDEPSCSLIESLGRQDLFINPIIALYASNLLWNLIRDEYISYQGMFINLESLNITTINL